MELNSIPFPSLLNMRTVLHTFFLNFLWLKVRLSYCKSSYLTQPFSPSHVLYLIPVLPLMNELGDKNLVAVLSPWPYTLSQDTRSVRLRHYFSTYFLCLPAGAVSTLINKLGGKNKFMGAPQSPPAGFSCPLLRLTIVSR